MLSLVPLWYPRFFRASEFTVPSLASFSPSYHLGVQDIALDSPSVPSCMHLRIKGSKTDPFRKGALSTLALAGPRSALCIWCCHISLAGVTSQVPCFCSRMCSLSRVPCSRTGSSKSWHLRTDSYIYIFFFILTLELCRASLKATLCNVGSLLKDLIYY